MPGSGNTTVPGSVDEPQFSLPAARLVPALILVWNTAEPHRLGEVALLEFSTLPELLLGREDLEKLPDPRLLRLLQQLPGRSIGCGPLRGNGVSRDQLRFRPTADGGVEVKTLGTPQFLINGEIIPKGVWRRLELEDVLLIAGHSAFLFTMRPVTLPALLDDAIVAGHRFGEPDASGMAGETPRMWELREQIAAAVRTGGNVLLSGETGTGKEPTAKAIHRLSGRKGAFVAFSVATLVDTLAESQLYGSAANYPNRGPARLGLFAAAKGGTLLLDEFGEPRPEMQAKLLRALDRDGEFTPLGETMARKVEALVIGATNQPFAKIREELLMRFRYVVRLPPLSARKEDIPLIARTYVLGEARKEDSVAARFVAQDENGRPYVRMSGAFVVAILRLFFKGNIRDLQKLLDRSIAETRGNELELPADMSDWQVRPSLPPPAPPPPLPPPQEPPKANPDDTERNPVVDGGEVAADSLLHTREAVLETLQRAGGNQTRAARFLNMNRFRFKRLMDAYGIKRPED